jgi:hypothetical protein
MQLPGHVWGRLAVEVTTSMRAIAREALEDVWAQSPPGSITGRTIATADPPGSDPRVDWFLDDVSPILYRTGSDPSERPRVLGLTCSFVLSVVQEPSGPTDESAIAAFGAIIGRAFESPLRLFVSAAIGGVALLTIERADMSPGERAEAFDASDRPLARAARYRVRVTEGTGTPDVPPADPVVLQPARIIVVHGATAAQRRAAAGSAVTGAPVAHVDLGGPESKWIGETEKNLAQAMDAAAASGAVLLFDEADALFGKRTDVAALAAAGATVVVTTADARLVRRLASQGAEVVDASET